MESLAAGEEVLGWESGMGNEELGWRLKAGLVPALPAGVLAVSGGE